MSDNNDYEKDIPTPHIASREDYLRLYYPHIYQSMIKHGRRQQQQQQPFTTSLSMGMRRPSSIRSIINRQNIDDRILYRTSSKHKVREASLYRTAATSPAIVPFLDGSEVIALINPYDSLAQLRFENCYRTDPVVRRCIDILAKFTMGKRTNFDIHIGPDPEEESMLVAGGFQDPTPTNPPLPSSRPTPGASSPATPAATGAVAAATPPPPNAATPRTSPPGRDMLDSEVNKMFGDDGGGDFYVESPLSEQELRELYRMIYDVNRKVKFDAVVKAALTQSYVYGRSVLQMLTDKQGIPTELKLLNSKKLETAYMDPETWKLVAVDYADRSRENPLLAEDIIYFANQDYHISPDSMFYGLSRIEPIVHTSETNQLLDEIDLKEGARSMWAGSGVIKFPPDTPDALVEEFVENFYPGTWNATSQSVKIDTYNLKLDYVALTNARMENDRRIIRGLGIPGFLVGFENISNRATAQEVMISWHESELDAERTWLRDTLESQWFDYLIGVRFPELLTTKNSPSTRVTSNNVAPVRVRLNFTNISFETMLERSQALIPLFDKGLVTPHKVTEIMRWPEDTDEILAELERREIEKERQFQIQHELQLKRAESYLLQKTQQGVEDRRQQQKDQEQQGLTAQASLNMIDALRRGQEKDSATNEFNNMQMKFLQESHKQDVDLRIQKKMVLDELQETIKKMRDKIN